MVRHYLMLGGPGHGMEREVPNGESEITVMAPSPGNPIPSPVRYTLREIEAETRPGMVFRRSVLVENSMPVEVATQALAAVLLQSFAEQLVVQFMEGGELVVGSDKKSPEFGSDGGGLLIAKR